MSSTIGAAALQRAGTFFLGSSAHQRAPEQGLLPVIANTPAAHGGLRASLRTGVATHRAPTVALAGRSGATLREAALWATAKASLRESVTRGMDRLGATLAAWGRQEKPKEPLFPFELFSFIATGFDLSLTYDVDALALVHRTQSAAPIMSPDGNPMARTLIEALRTPGSKVRFVGDRLELLAPTPGSVAEHQERLTAARRGRVVGGPRLRGVRPENVWYDGTAPLNLDALVGDASAARRRVVERATAMVSHRWQGSSKNTHHGLGADGVWTDTPDTAFVVNGFGRAGQTNVGLPYFYGGFNDLASFDRGIAAGLPAGHIFEVTPTFREDNPYTPIGVGVDCSGFVAQAWGLETKIGTPGIEDRTTPLQSYAELRPGDVVMKVLQHVMLFVGRRGDKLLLMESTPPRCIGQALTAAELEAMEMLPRAAKWLDDGTAG